MRKREFFYMTVRKKKFIAVIFCTLFLAVLVTVFVLTRSVFWHNVQDDCRLTTITDADYLGVWDLRTVPTHREDDYIRELGESLVAESLKNNGSISSDGENIISESNFEYINPRSFLAGEEYSVTDENFSLIENDVISNGDRAIYFWRQSYNAVYRKKSVQGESDTQDISLADDELPSRLYMEKENGQWTVKKVFVTWNFA